MAIGELAVAINSYQTLILVVGSAANGVVIEFETAIGLESQVRFVENQCIVGPI
jgi:hypothetical protein